MKTNVAVLGCGMVGATMVRDLANESRFSITAADLSRENLDAVADEVKVATVQEDLSNAAVLQRLIRHADLVVGALPSFLGFETLKTVIECGKPYADISFMPEEFMDLDGLAKAKGVTAVVDCGLAPGLSNLIAGHLHAECDETHRVEIYGGGLPKVRQWPYEYKAPFAPGDVIEEYTRPARLVEYGELVVKPALSDPELIDFPQVGTLEAFNTDGLRSLLTNIKARHMKEKTLRYPGHVQLMRALRDSGFFDKIHIDVHGVKVRPLDVTSKLLFPLWAFEEDEEEFTLLRVIVDGRKGDKHLRHTYELYEEYDKVHRVSAMARTTAFPNVIAARMLLDGRFPDPGVYPPELLARYEGTLQHMIEQLDARGVTLTAEVAELRE